jgi:hypothetical protein
MPSRLRQPVTVDGADEHGQAMRSVAAVSPRAAHGSRCARSRASKAAAAANRRRLRVRRRPWMDTRPGRGPARCRSGFRHWADASPRPAAGPERTLAWTAAGPERMPALDGRQPWTVAGLDRRQPWTGHQP